MELTSPPAAGEKKTNTTSPLPVISTIRRGSVTERLAVFGGALTSQLVE